MSLSADEVLAVIAECRERLRDVRVENVHQCDECTLVLTLYGQSAGKQFLFLSARPRLARVYLVSPRPPALPRPPPFCEAARSQLKRLCLVGIRETHGGRRVEFRFASCSEDRSVSPVDLVLAMTPGREELLLLKNDARRRCRIGIARLRPAAKRSVNAQPDKDHDYAEPDTFSMESSGSVGDVAISEELARRFVDVEASTTLQERKDELLRLSRRELRRREQTLLRVEADLHKAQGAEAQRLRGELLRSAIPQIRRGMTSIEVVNYFDPNLEKVQVELDPALAPQENVERYFKLYRKGKRAIPYIEKRLARLSAEAETLRDLGGRVGACGTLAELDAVEPVVRPLLRRPGRRAPGSKTPGTGSSGRTGPRRFVSVEGYEILVGRNARGNDELSMRLARGNDVFLHVAGRPGAHVVIRTIPGKSVPQGTLLDAAQLALYYALPEKLRRMGGPQASADVDYTPAKYVQKPKGTRPGLVYLTKHKTLRVQLEEDRMERLRHSTEASS